MDMITLATLGKATAQQVFDQVAKHLLTQNQKSAIIGVSGTSACKYRADDGLKCAAGCLISDAEYNPSMEGVDWDELVTIGAVPANHQQLILSLQAIHDDHKPSEWPRALKDAAIFYDLEYTFL